ncbi:hypothetical protein Veis_4062 [Verminephrobacter eiseniae EF01-2]|uniref:Uncharacterized protein n=1 Tax=Verminephrobacter eiseniae (strain EF01-2) TaxID=391735 RepID=A1WQ60_VEREI|nr:hypothetical protein Veis_4062 [Verminephrobacter eiseniae EF01-2]
MQDSGRHPKALAAKANPSMALPGPYPVGIWLGWRGGILSIGPRPGHFRVRRSAGRVCWLVAATASVAALAALLEGLNGAPTCIGAGPVGRFSGCGPCRRA